MLIFTYLFRELNFSLEGSNDCIFLLFLFSFLSERTRQRGSLLRWQLPHLRHLEQPPHNSKPPSILKIALTCQR